VERAQLLQFIEIIGRNPIMAVDDVVLRALVNKFPALANNDLLIQRLQAVAQFAVQMMLGGGQAGKIEQKTTGGEAAKSRQVATGR